MNKYYLNDWENKDQEHIFDEFEVEKEDRNVNILFATYNYEYWEGNAFVIAEKDGKLFEVHAFHCSCYGLEGQFELEETNVEAIEHYINEGHFHFGHGYKDELIEFIKEYKEKENGL